MIRKLFPIVFLQYSIKKRTSWVLICFIIAAYLMFAIPINVQQMPKKHTLEIYATGEKDPKAKGSEVWIQSIKISDNEIDRTKLQLDEGWEFRKNSILSYQNQPAVLKYSGWSLGVIIRNDVIFFRINFCDCSCKRSDNF